jgi:hypothetical protein
MVEVTNNCPQLYRRVEVDVHPLTSSVPLSKYSLDVNYTQTGVVDAMPTELPEPVKAETYVFIPVEQLEKEIWSFQDFLEKNSSKWA